jgi:NAD+ synthase (glutamine-hydrolysing)
MKKLRLALAQMNPTVGDLKGNADRIIKYIAEAKKKGAELVAFPELALSGYPPEDLLLKPRFIKDNLRELKRIAARVKGIVAVIGFVDAPGKDASEIYNAAAIISGGRIVDVYHKTILPNYGIFDEHRYFSEGSRCPVYRIGETTLGINICEDIWHPEGPLRLQAMAGAELIVNINASPYSIGKPSKREKVIMDRIKESPVPVAYLNSVGGQDEVVFDGASLIMDRTGKVLERAGKFREELLVSDIKIGRSADDIDRHRRAALMETGEVEFIDISTSVSKAKARPRLGSKRITPMSLEAEVYEALKLGVSDYLRKNGFNRGAIIGLSGGIDSALVAAIAVDALGAENVRCVFMPSPYSSTKSRDDAEALAKNLGVRYDVIAIEELMAKYDEALRPLFKGKKPDVTEENLQARIRGNLLMALSNKTGAIVLTTGNKSEMSVGYATLYGDMAGGFAVIKDVPKTMVYALARWRNRKAKKAVIPRRIITREPTAELREDQRDSDSLPPYEVLDPILAAYIEGNRSLEGMLKLGLGDPKTIRRVIELVDRSEYKRRQSPPGIKITSRAFGRDWRVPITNRYRAK